MAWQNPKTDWKAGDVPTASDFNRIEGNINTIETGSRTIDQNQAPTGLIGTLRQLLDWFANRIKAILGTTNWYDAPPTTLTAAKSHIDAAAPHSGHLGLTEFNAKFHATTGHKHTGEAGDGPALIHHQVFATSGTWTKPAGCKVVYVECYGAGGGGGSGGRYHKNTLDEAGGGGGGGGGFSKFLLEADLLANECLVVVGAGGAGGEGITYPTQNGNAGGGGGTTSFTSPKETSPVGTEIKLYAVGGNGGAGGSSSGALGGAGGIDGLYVDTLQHKGSSGGDGRPAAKGYTGGPSRCQAGGGGGAGGGAKSSYYSGGAGGSRWTTSGGGGGAGGYAAPGGHGENIGDGGGGGSGSTGGGGHSAYNGGIGGVAGGGGGGGARTGSELETALSGAGGAGGRGEVRIWAW